MELPMKAVMMVAASMLKDLMFGEKILDGRERLVVIQAELLDERHASLYPSPSLEHLG